MRSPKLQFRVSDMVSKSQASRSRWMRIVGLVTTLCVQFGAWSVTFAQQDDPSTNDSSVEESVQDPEARESAHDHSLFVSALLFVPNRLFDLVDIARVRARVGPGLAVGVRATEYAQLYLGSYGALFAGLPGPRMSAHPPISAGIESKSGVTVSVFDASLDGGFGPNYSPTEFGVSAQLVILGVDVGIDPVEVADFFAGFVGADIRDDDL